MRRRRGAVWFAARVRVQERDGEERWWGGLRGMGWTGAGAGTADKAGMTGGRGPQLGGTAMGLAVGYCGRSCSAVDTLEYSYC